MSALHHHFGDNVSIEGADAGLHIVAWLRGIGRSSEDALLTEAKREGIGIHPVSPLYHSGTTSSLPDYVGLLMGYSALEPQQIRGGVELLAKAVARVRA
ncbi:hypothetical protein [Novosphingobium album (ex Liu et al. 2023)]|uniref:PLP-dependent aminotransferase family protein n=1 Tax=Novosphingobium album (ex Liu et al. 2023) TaxID=3031130 RepID=A0ABT5WXU9_9SPHN|nr:hypothetical protein [Novosphingobium album (ex Liu et al. 2023)]MDE8654709.1 hypothetical protein [Novosphingobium album (ex Liu et al. 2023)]